MFDEKYWSLFQFFTGWFPEMYFDNLTEEEVIKEYKKTIYDEELVTVIGEAEEIKSEISDYWKRMSMDTNIRMKNEQEALDWLNKIINLLKK